MRRSGSTLQYQIASELIERSGLGRRTTFYRPDRQDEVLAGTPPGGLSTFKTHTLTPAARDLCLTGRALILYVFRDLRDVISSIQQKRNSRFEDGELEMAVLELIRSDNEWRSLPGAYVARYEDVVTDIQAETERIARAIQVNRAPEELKHIAETLSLESQQIRIRQIPTSSFIEIDSNNAYDPVSLLHRNHIQSGKAGRYRFDLDPRQIMTIERLAGGWLRLNRYET